MNSSSFDAAEIQNYRRALDRSAQAAKSDATAKPARTNALPPPPPEKVASALGIKAITIEWLAGDGSDRCYYRLFSPELTRSLVLMQLSGTDAAALRADGYDWIKIAALLEARGLFVPKVVATMPEHAALVIEDYGDVMLEGLIFAHAERDEAQEVRALYSEASEIIAAFLKIPPSPEVTWCRRSFDTERFVWELNFFVQKYVAPVTGWQFSRSEQTQFDADVKALASALASNSHYFVHRDFHSRNVMVRGGRLAVIDFQDARLGPASYDLVSLCFDSYVPLTAATRALFLADGLEIIRRRAGSKAHDEAHELWRPMLLQRQLKAIGSFGFLTLDKQKGDYLRYVSPALKTIEDQRIEDERWPFLSGELVRQVRSHLERVTP